MRQSAPSGKVLRLQQQRARPQQFPSFGPGWNQSEQSSIHRVPRVLEIFIGSEVAPLLCGKLSEESGISKEAAGGLGLEPRKI